MAKPTLEFASIDLSSAKIYTTSSAFASEFIRVGVTYTAGSDQATVVGDKVGFLGSGSIEPGMMLRSSGEYTDPTRITAYNPGTKVVTLESTSAASNVDEYTFITPPAGWIYVATSSFAKPGGSSINPPQDFRSITGSEDAEYVAGDLKWGIIGQLEATSSAGTGLTGKYAQYEITRVLTRDNDLTISFYASASAAIPAFEEPTGYSLTYNQSFLMLSQLKGSFMSIAGANDLAGGGQGLGLAAYNNVVGSTIAALTSGSSGAGGFPFSGSAEITGSLAVTGSSEFTIPVGNKANNFFIKSGSAANDPRVFNVNGEGTIQFFAQDNAYIPTAVLGGLYFTSASAYIGIE